VISRTQAAEYLEQSLGITLPAFIVGAAVDQVEATEPAMITAGYAEPKRIQVQAMAVAIIAAAGAPRRAQAQGAPSGASRSFKNHDDALSQLRRTLAALDTAGIVTELVGPDPAGATLLMVV
jgi:hypothetical protein